MSAQLGFFMSLFAIAKPVPDAPFYDTLATPDQKNVYLASLLSLTSHNHNSASAVFIYIATPFQLLGNKCGAVAS